MWRVKKTNHIMKKRQKKIRVKVRMKSVIMIQIVTTKQTVKV
jgi:hypothetical protein